MRTFSSLAALMFVAYLFTGAVVARQVGHPKESHQHPEAAKLKNPVPADAASLEAGKKLYTEQCAGCHGDAGKGDGPMAAYTGEPLPSDLSDVEWSHGSTDGEIYTIIRDGIDGTAMKDFAKDLKETEIWQVVNYVKTLAPKPAH
jgi:mono/diheme cytochrome c family protein